MQVQPTGFMAGVGFPQQQQLQQPQMTGLPQPLEPQRTAVPGMPGMGMGMGMGGMGGMTPAPMQIQQPTGFMAGGGFGQPQQQQQQPQQQQQQMMPQVTGFGGVGGRLQPMQPLVPQQTGPAPPVRFGVTEGAKKIAPQATGRRANLAAASKFILFVVMRSDGCLLTLVSLQRRIIRLDSDSSTSTIR
jgi:hypothetical protein